MLTTSYGEFRGQFPIFDLKRILPAYRATLLIKYLEINDLSKVLFDGDIQG